MRKKFSFSFFSKNRINIFICFAIVLMISPNNITCQKILTLEDCIKLAQNNNLDVKQAMQNEKDAIIENEYSKQQIYPTVNANSVLSYNLGRGIDPITNSYLSQSFLGQGLNINTEMTLFNGYKFKYELENSILNIQSAKFETEQIKREIVLVVTNIYLNLIFNRENLKNAENNINSTINQKEKIKKLVELGLKLKSEISQLEAQIFREKENIISINGEIENNTIDLKNILRLDSELELIILTPKIDIKNIAKEKKLSNEELISISLQNNRNYLSYIYKEKSAQLQNEIAKAKSFPVLKLGGNISTNFSNKSQEISGYQDTISHQLMIIDNVPKDIGIPTLVPVLENRSYFNQIKNNWGVGVWLQVSIPIYNNYTNKMQIQKAKINEVNIHIAKEKLEREIISNTLKAYSETRVAFATHDAAQKTYDAQNELFTVISKQFEAGKINIYDYKKAKSDFENAQNRLLVTKYELIFKSKILDFYQGKEITFEYE